MAAFESAWPKLEETLKNCISGREKISRGEEQDIELASELGISGCIPLLIDGAFRSEAYLIA